MAATAFIVIESDNPDREAAKEEIHLLTLAACHDWQFFWNGKRLSATIQLADNFFPDILERECGDFCFSDGPTCDKCGQALPAATIGPKV